MRLQMSIVSASRSPERLFLHDWPGLTRSSSRSGLGLFVQIFLSSISLFFLSSLKYVEEAARCAASIRPPQP